MKDNYPWAEECLDMVRQRLESCGLSMDGCPPMMYDDAITTLVARIGKYAEIRTWDHLRAIVRRPTALVWCAPGDGETK